MSDAVTVVIDREENKAKAAATPKRKRKAEAKPEPKAKAAKPPARKHARARPEMPRISENYPPGYGATARKQKVDRAIRAIGKRYPKMSASELRDYLVEVGAGRVLALYNYAAED